MNERKHAPLVLVVDDDLSITRTATGFLERAGFRTANAGSISSALRNVRQHNPDLILLDVELPDGSGVELCRLLQSEVTTSRIPVLFISAHDNTAVKVRGFEAGGLDFITKPIVGAEVIARVRTHLKLQQAYERLSELHAERLQGLASAQQTLMPCCRSGSSARFYASVRQVSSAGGDFYDVIPAGEDVVDYLVADASGHDLASSLWTASLKALAAEYASPLNLPGEIVIALNDSLYRLMPPGAFFTLVYARLNHGTGRLSLVNAGHPPAVVVRADGEQPVFLRGEGDVIGAFPDAVFGSIELNLNPGDRLWLFTDGLLENSQSYEQALRRVADACDARRGLPLASAVPSVIDDLIGDFGPTDDLLLLGVNR